jgi:hypothetical protein
VRRHVCIGNSRLAGEAASRSWRGQRCRHARGSQPPPSGQALLSSHSPVKATANSLHAAPWVE